MSDYADALGGHVRDLLHRQTRAVEERLRDMLTARGIDPDDRSDGWEDRARAALGDLEVVEGPIIWTGDWSARIETTIRPRQAPDRRMGYGFGPWTADTLQACRCGHLRGDHFRHASSCLHSTDTETWACDCPEFELR